MQFHFFPQFSQMCVYVFSLGFLGSRVSKVIQRLAGHIFLTLQNLCGILPGIRSSFPLKLKLSCRFCGMSFDEPLVKFLEEV